MQLLDASCGVLVIQNFDVSVSAGVLAVTPIVRKWANGQVVVSLGNNKIVRPQVTFPSVDSFCLTHERRDITVHEERH